MKPERTNLVEKYGNASRLKKRVSFAPLSPTFLSISTMERSDDTYSLLLVLLEKLRPDSIRAYQTTPACLSNMSAFNLDCVPK